MRKAVACLLRLGRKFVVRILQYGFWLFLLTSGCVLDSAGLRALGDAARQDGHDRPRKVDGETSDAEPDGEQDDDVTRDASDDDAHGDADGGVVNDDHDAGTSADDDDADDAGDDDAGVVRPVERARILFLKVAFPGEPFSATPEQIEQAHEELNAFYGAMSRYTLQFDVTVYPEVLETPESSFAYAADFTKLYEWLLDEAQARGLRAEVDYDVLVAAHPWAPVTYGGHAVVSERLLLINGWSALTGSTYAHEMGHIWGVNHAHGIMPRYGVDVFGWPGDHATHSEYGNPFDVMGQGSAREGHFSMPTKQRLGWTDAEEVLEVTQSGTYRLYAHDNAVHEGRLLAIRVASKHPEYAYWFEYRANFEASRQGALALFQGYWSNNPYLSESAKDDHWVLDGSYGVGDYFDDLKDVVWRPGQSFRDKYGDAEFEVVAVSSGPPGPDSWVEVKVTLP